MPPTAALEGLAAALSVSVDDATAALTVARRGSA
jgi:hypothetical protein